MFLYSFVGIFLKLKFVWGHLLRVNNAHTALRSAAHTHARSTRIPSMGMWTDGDYTRQLGCPPLHSLNGRDEHKLYCNAGASTDCCATSACAREGAGRARCRVARDRYQREARICAHLWRQRRMLIIFFGLRRELLTAYEITSTFNGFFSLPRAVAGVVAVSLSNVSQEWRGNQELGSERFFGFPFPFARKAARRGRSEQDEIIICSRGSYGSFGKRQFLSESICAAPVRSKWRLITLSARGHPKAPILMWFTRKIFQPKCAVACWRRLLSWSSEEKTAKWGNSLQDIFVDFVCCRKAWKWFNINASTLNEIHGEILSLARFAWRKWRICEHVTVMGPSSSFAHEKPNRNKTHLPQNNIINSILEVRINIHRFRSRCLHFGLLHLARRSARVGLAVTVARREAGSQSLG